MAGTTRYFGRLPFKHETSFSNKKDAQEFAENLRRRGHRARITKGTKAGYGRFYTVWRATIAG